MEEAIIVREAEVGRELEKSGCGVRPTFRCLVSDTTYVYSIMTLLWHFREENQSPEPKP